MLRRITTLNSSPRFRRVSNETLRPVQLRQYVNFMRNRGFDPQDVVADSGIDAARLSDAEYLVDAESCHLVVANIVRLTGNPAIGLEVGAATNLNDLGIVGYAMASSGTLGQAIAIWMQYGNTTAGCPFRLDPIGNLDRDRWGVTAATNGVSGAIYRFYIEEIMTMGMSFCRLLTSVPFEIGEIAFSFPAPKHRTLYEDVFRCPIAFSAPITRVIIDSPSLDTPLNSDDSELRELCIRQCGRLVRQIERHGPVSSKLRRALTTMGAIPSLEDAAELMNMSPRSLRRYLKAEDTSFQSILDEFRGDLAREYLRAGVMSAKEIAGLLGFSHPDTFRRAFKAWTGTTIGDFQGAG